MGGNDKQKRNDSTIQALFWTYQLDIVQTSRSYHHMGISYEQLLADILKDYPNAMYIVELPPNRRYDTFIVQYQAKCVVRIDSRLEKEILIHTYTLAPNEHIALQGTGENTTWIPVYT